MSLDGKLSEDVAQPPHSQLLEKQSDLHGVQMLAQGSPEIE